MVGHALEEMSEVLALLVQHGQNLELGVGFRRGLHNGPHECGEIEAFECLQLRGTISVLLKFRAITNVHQRFADGARFRRGAKSIVLFADLFSDGQGIFSNSAKTFCEFFGSVVVHESILRYIHTRMAFDLQPTLKGELVELRPLRAEDFDALYAVARDPLIWEQHPAQDRYQEEVFRGFFREAMASGGALIGNDRKDGCVIGSSRFHGYDEANSEIEIGWTFLARSHWGGTYNGEMKELMLRHAFRFVKSVVFLVGPLNLRSQKAVEKIGGVRAGSRVDGSGRESFVYRIGAQ